MAFIESFSFAFVRRKNINGGHSKRYKNMDKVTKFPLFDIFSLTSCNEECKVLDCAVAGMMNQPNAEKQ